MTTRRSFLAAVGLLLAAAPHLPAQFDLVIRGGRVLDGSGNPWRYADVGVRGDRIITVGDLAEAEAKRVLDATGMYVAPGFIDVHSHAARGLSSEALSHGHPLLAQGLTTVVVNPDGGGPIDIAWQRGRLLEHGLGVNVAQLVPHGAVRRAVLRMVDRAPSEAQLDAMRERVRRGMQEGAFGLSSGLFYAPGSYSATEEVIALAKVAAEFGGVYSSHIRDESDYNIGLVAAVDEVIRIAREAELPGIVSHIKALGPRVWGFSHAVVSRIERAREEGVQVYADQYPYEASGTSITGALVPRWAQVGGREAMVGRLANDEERARLRADIVDNLDRRGGAERLRFQGSDPELAGRTMQAVADERGVEPADLVLSLMSGGGAGLTSFNMQEDDIAAFMQQPWTMTCTDGGLVAMGNGSPHPRSYGAFARKLKRYVVEQRVIDLPTAVRSMTSLPATVFGIEGRGHIQENAFADICVFDLQRVDDKATYRRPHQLAEGMVFVLVNGQLAVDAGEFTGAKAGTVLRKDR